MDAMCRARSLWIPSTRHCQPASTVSLSTAAYMIVLYPSLCCADESYPPANCPSVGVTVGQWSSWSASCGQAERTRSVTQCRTQYPVSYAPAPAGYYDARCYVTCQTSVEKDYTNGAACPICMLSCVVSHCVRVFAKHHWRVDAVPTAKPANYPSNNYNSDACSTLPCPLGFSCLNLQGGQYTCLPTSSLDSSSETTTTASPSSSGLGSVTGTILIAGLRAHAFHIVSNNR
jgi:hypothetical protein